jgi:hypothetical protein
MRALSFATVDANMGDQKIWVLNKHAISWMML